MKDLIDGYVKRVRELAEHVRGNEQATKQSLVGPLFTLLGYDLTDPRECVPEFRADFGKDRSVKPVDWAFVQTGRPLFFVEAKEASRKLVGYDEQLADYFAKAPEAKLGILTNGIQWRFFTDVTHENVMDVEPFLKWDLFSEESPPLDFLTLLQKSQFNSQLIRTFAKQKRNQNLLLNEISRLLEPSADFIRLAVSNLETRKLTENVVESWKPVLAAALQEWVKQTMLSMAIDFGARTESQQESASRIETTPEELEGYATVQKLLGPDRPVAYEDTISYFKIHLKERYTWVMCRFYFGRKRPTVWVPLSIEEAGPLASQFPMMTPQQGWTCLSLDSSKDLESLGDLLRKAYDQQRANRVKVAEGTEKLGPPKAESNLPGADASA
jgi:predicted type IV restriction endonuclease